MSLPSLYCGMLDMKSRLRYVLLRLNVKSNMSLNALWHMAGTAVTQPFHLFG